MSTVYDLQTALEYWSDEDLLNYAADEVYLTSLDKGELVILLMEIASRFDAALAATGNAEPIEDYYGHLRIPSLNGAENDED